MKLFILTSVLMLSGCASNQSLLQAYGDHYNNMDPCQYTGKKEGHMLPNYCFTNQGKTVYSVKDINNKVIYTIH